MTTCPDVSLLLTSKADAHLQSCKSCQTLMRLHSDSAQALSSDCEAVELLLAVRQSDTLSDLDTRTLEQHLSACNRCLSLSVELLLESDDMEVPVLSVPSKREQREDIWHPANDLDEQRDRSGRARTISILGLVGLVAAAAMLFFVLRSETEVESPIVSQQHVVKPGETKPTPTVKTPTINTESPAPQHLVSPGKTKTTPTMSAGSSRPDPLSLLSIEELIASSITLTKSKSFDEGYKRCSEVLRRSPGHQKANFVCAIIACNLKDGLAARLHTENITDRTKIAGLRQICTRHGVEVVAKDTDTDDKEVHDEGAVSALLRGDVSSEDQRMVKIQIELAKSHTKNKRFGAALHSSSEALALSPNNQEAHALSVVSACRIKKKSLAHKHIKKITNSDRQNSLVKTCLRNGIEFENLSVACSKLGRSDVSKAIAEVKPAVLLCGEAHPNQKKTSTRVSLRIKINREGRVKSIALSDTPKTPLSQCVLRTVKKARFPTSCDGTTVVYPFTFR